MFESLFRRTRSVDIDHLIFDIAEHRRAKDYDRFCRLLRGRTFFLQVDPSSIIGMPVGVPYRTNSADNMKLTGLAQIKGVTLLPLYTSRDDKRLKDSYVEIEGLEALRMAVKAKGIAGVLFQNKGESWVVLSTEQIKTILAKHGN